MLQQSEVRLSTPRQYPYIYMMVNNLIHCSREPSSAAVHPFTNKKKIQPIIPNAQQCARFLAEGSIHMGDLSCQFLHNAVGLR